MNWICIETIHIQQNKCKQTKTNNFMKVDLILNFFSDKEYSLPTSSKEWNTDSQGQTGWKS